MKDPFSASARRGMWMVGLGSSALLILSIAELGWGVPKWIRTLIIALGGTLLIAAWWSIRRSEARK
jgi:hypothetical protein